MNKRKKTLGVMALLALFSGYSISAYAAKVNFTTISTSAHKGVYALTLSEINNTEAEILRPEYFSGEFLDASDLRSEQTYKLSDRNPIYLQGLGDLFSGTFYVTEVTHRVSNSESGFETVFLIERDQLPLVDNSGNTNINLLFSNIRLETRTSTQGGTEILELTISPDSFLAAPWLFGTVLVGLALVGLIGLRKHRRAV